MKTEEARKTGRVQMRRARRRKRTNGEKAQERRWTRKHETKSDERKGEMD